jgi:hypothetical protein
MPRRRSVPHPQPTSRTPVVVKQTPAPDPIPPRISQVKAVLLYDLSDQTIGKIAARHWVPRRKVGSRVYYDRDPLQRAIEEWGRK